MNGPEDTTAGDRTDGRSDEQPVGPEVGSVAEEAAKLMGALSGWAREQGDTATGGVAGSVAGLADLAKDLDGHVAGENCTYCPVCRVIAMVRATSPEVKTHLTSAATSLLQAAMSALATPVPDEARRRQTGVERIDLDDGPDWSDD